MQADKELRRLKSGSRKFQGKGDRSGDGPVSQGLTVQTYLALPAVRMGGQIGLVDG